MEIYKRKSALTLAKELEEVFSESDIIEITNFEKDLYYDELPDFVDEIEFDNVNISDFIDEYSLTAGDLIKTKKSEFYLFVSGNYAKEVNFTE